MLHHVACLAVTPAHDPLNPSPALPLLQNTLPTGGSDAVRQALRSKGHERLMRAIHFVAAGGNAQQVALHGFGKWTMQHLLDAAHLLRVEALELSKQVCAGLGGWGRCLLGCIAAAFAAAVLRRRAVWLCVDASDVTPGGGAVLVPCRACCPPSRLPRSAMAAPAPR